jgi:hypothetical protein
LTKSPKQLLSRVKKSLEISSYFCGLLRIYELYYAFKVWDARSPHAVRSIYGVFVCGEGLAFDRRGRELMVAHWRPWRNLQFIDYSTGQIFYEGQKILTRSCS